MSRGPAPRTAHQASSFPLLYSFTNQYNDRQFLFDIHPPLGKLVLFWVSRTYGYDHTVCEYEGCVLAASDSGCARVHTPPWRACERGGVGWRCTTITVLLLWRYGACYRLVMPNVDRQRCATSAIDLCDSLIDSRH